jgi:hypothetical protein
MDTKRQLHLFDELVEKLKDEIKISTRDIAIDDILEDSTNTKNKNDVKLGIK